MSYIAPTRTRVRLGGARVDLTAARAAKVAAKATLDPRRNAESALDLAMEEVRRVCNRVDRGKGDSRFRRYVKACVGIGGDQSVESLAGLLSIADGKLATLHPETHQAVGAELWLQAVKGVVGQA